MVEPLGAFFGWHKILMIRGVHHKRYTNLVEVTQTIIGASSL